MVLLMAKNKANLKKQRNGCYGYKMKKLRYMNLVIFFSSEIYEVDLKQSKGKAFVI